MPLPTAISSNPLAYALISTNTIPVAGRTIVVVGKAPIPGPIKQKRFFNYIEVLEQGAHDPAIRTLAIQRNMTPRPMHDGRVSPLNTGANPLTYYAPNGLVVAQVVSKYMTKKWTENTKPEDTVFLPNTPYLPSVQSKPQSDGYRYEITMWYDRTDVYTAFHCYK